MQIEIRSATPDDRDQLYELYGSVLKGHITKIWGWDESWQQRDFDEHFLPEGIRLAVINGHIVAYIHGDSSKGKPHIRMICVSPEYQRKGIGSTLLKLFIRDNAAGQGELRLEVFRTNTDVLPFYEKFGFKVMGKTKTHFELARRGEPISDGGLSKSLSG